MVPVRAREGADQNVGAVVDLAVGIHAVAAALGVAGVGDVGIVGDHGIGVDKGCGKAVMGDVAVLHVELHAQVGGEGLALVIGKVRDLDVELLVGGGVEEELAALDLVLAHLDGVGIQPLLHA